jgi:hypothetical protein
MSESTVWKALEFAKLRAGAEGNLELALKGQALKGQTGQSPHRVTPVVEFQSDPRRSF